MIDHDTEFGARVARHLREEIVVWLTTVTPRGAPLPMPVWFLWDGAESIVMYSRPGARVRNIQANARVTLNFAGDGGGGDIVVLSGAAAVDDGAPPADRAAEYRAKYNVPVRIQLLPERASGGASAVVASLARRSMMGHDLEVVLRHRPPSIPRIGT